MASIEDLRAQVADLAIKCQHSSGYVVASDERLDGVTFSCNDTSMSVEQVKDYTRRAVASLKTLVDESLAYDFQADSRAPRVIIDEVVDKCTRLIAASESVGQWLTAPERVRMFGLVGRSVEAVKTVSHRIEELHSKCLDLKQKIKQNEDDLNKSINFQINLVNGAVDSQDNYLLSLKTHLTAIHRQWLQECVQPLMDGVRTAGDGLVVLFA